MQKIKGGPRKYKGNIFSKCYNCGKIGHFVVKCSYEKRENFDDEHVNKVS